MASRKALEEEPPPRTTAELAEYLGVSERALTQWRYWKKGPRWVKVGRHIRYPRRDTQEWLDAGADSPEMVLFDADLPQLDRRRSSPPGPLRASRLTRT
jgi:hypothetical protein